MPFSFAVEQSSPPLSTRQQAVFTQLVDLYLKRGFAGFTIEDAAVELRCSKSTIYALAGSREQLIRRVVVWFFRNAAERVEDQIAGKTDPLERLIGYLTAVAAALKPASPAFMDDVAAFAPAQEIYERNTTIATERVHDLIHEGIRAEAFRDVPAEFVAEVTSSVMVRIQRREFSRRIGMSDAEAYANLANLLVNGLMRHPS